MSWLPGRSQILNRRIAVSIRGRCPSHSSSPVFLASCTGTRSAHSCSDSSRSFADCELIASGFAGCRQLSETGLASTPKTTYEGIHYGDREHLDSLRKLSHNSLGVSRASFVANDCRRGLEDHYMLGSVLGRGATATVYQSLSYQTCQKVAVKAIQKKFMRSERLWQNEIQIHRAVDHPNILRLLDTFEDDNMVYLVTELCQGGDLSDYLDNQEEDDGTLLLSEDAILQLFQQMVCSVHYLHQRGIVHRDIKPGNFLCNTSGGASASGAGAKRPTVKLADFGIAAYCGDMKHLLTKTVGSDGYIAPEVMQRQPYSEKADIFSLGCILHKMLTGSPPEVLDGAHIVDETRLQAASEDLRSLVKSLTERRPEKRPSAEDLMELPLLRHSQSQLNEATVPLGDQLLDRMHEYSSFPLLKRAALIAMVSQTASDVDFSALTAKFISMSSSRRDLWNCARRPGITSEDIYATLLQEQIMFKPLQPLSGLSGCRLHNTTCRIRNASQSLCCRKELHRDVQGFVSKIDVSGTIGYSEWLAATLDSSWYTDPKKITAAFKLFDQDGDGFVSEDDLKRVLPDVFERLPIDVVMKGTDITMWQSGGMTETDFSMLVCS